MTQPIPDLNLHLPTALILIDNQSAFTHPDTLSHWGTARSNPHYEENLQSLVSSFRAAKAQAQALEAATSPSASTSEPKSVEKQAPTLEIIHIFHSSDSPTSPLHHAHPLNGIQPLAFAAPATDGTEPIFWKNVNSAFIGTTLEAYLRARDIRQIVCAGLTTDHCVSTTVRMAANLGVVDRPRSVGNGRVRFRSDGSRENEVSVDKGRVILAADATATFGKGGFDAETVHRVSVASLEGEFADVMDTEAIVQALNRVGGGGKASIVDD